MIDYGDDWGPAEETGGAQPPVNSDDNRRVSGGEPPDNLSASRDESGRFLPGVSGNPGAQFQPGRSGNPAGRPKGSFRAGARVALAMADAAAPELMQNLIALGRGRDGVSARFVLARTMGTRRGQPVEIDLPTVAAPADLGAAVGAITAAVADGSLTPEEALHLSRMLGHVPAVLAAMPPPRENEEDVHERLIRRLDRLAATIPKDVRRARLLEDLAALDADPPPAGERALSHSADERVDEIGEERPAEQQEQRHQREVGALAGAAARLGGVDVLRGLAEAQRGERDHRRAHDDQQQPGDVADQLVPAEHQLGAGLGAREAQEQVELGDDKAERHDRDARPHPGEKGALVRGMVAVAFDHRI